jgi:uncharacterized protein
VLTSVIVVIVGLSSLLALIWAVQRSLMYFPMHGVPAPETLGIARVEAVSFPTADGLTLHGWLFASPTPGATMLVCNGNAGHRAYRAPLAEALRDRGFTVLLFDYRGYGDNDGSPTEQGLAADARAARAFLLGRPDLRDRPLIYFGESLGAAVAVELAEAHPPAALVLRSPFTSMLDMGRLHYPILPVRWLLRDRYPSRDRIARVRAPLLVIAGDGDHIIPVDNSRQLYESAASPQKQWVVVSGADHNDEALLSGRTLVDAVVRFAGESGLLGR